MFFRPKNTIIKLIAIAFLMIPMTDLYAQKGKSSFGGSKSFSSSSSKFSSGSTKPTTSTKPSVSKFSSGSTTKSPTSTKFSSGSNSATSGTINNSSKPIASSSEKTKANQAESNKSKYTATTKAVLPPKSTYKTPDGKEVKVRTNSSTVKDIRNKPSTYYTPSARQSRVTNHVTTHHYNHNYDWYHTQPSFYVGGGYSSAFWWMMSEWSAERRAMWFYHNQNNIDSSAYQRGVQDAEVAERLKKLESENLVRNSDYIDSEFTNDPSMMYSQEYVEAAYNPQTSSSSNWTYLWWGLIIVVGLVAVPYLITKIKFGV